MKVVDTSVVLKWFVAENGSDAAAELIGTSLIAPDLLLAELGNAVWKKWRKGEIGAEQAHNALAEAPLSIELLPALPLLSAALQIAVEFEHPVYDCAFLALAEQSQCSLITADARLVARFSSSRFKPYLEQLGIDP